MSVANSTLHVPGVADISLANHILNIHLPGVTGVPGANSKLHVLGVASVPGTKNTLKQPRAHWLKYTYTHMLSCTGTLFKYSNHYRHTHIYILDTQADTYHTDSQAHKDTH